MFGSGTDEAEKTMESIEKSKALAPRAVNLNSSVCPANAETSPPYKVYVGAVMSGTKGTDWPPTVTMSGCELLEESDLNSRDRAVTGIKPVCAIAAEEFVGEPP